MLNYRICCLLLFVFLSCGGTERPAGAVEVVKDSVNKAVQNLPMPVAENGVTTINTGNTTPAELLAFAQTLTGTPYLYGSTDPAQGFDCSGFITYVFNHFNIAVPRASADFTFVNHEVDLKQAKTGDLVLFTGTDSTIRKVGHMGILIARPGQDLAFIHSTSGKAKGVTETPLNPYYMGRFMKVVRIFPQNEK